jgi:hypothetical protein
LIADSTSALKRKPAKEKEPTFVIGKTIQVHLHREIVAVFRRNHIRAIFSFQHLLRAILHQFVEAFDLDRNENPGLGLWSRDVEGNAIKIRHSLIDVDRRGTGRDTFRGVKNGTKSGDLP